MSNRHEGFGISYHLMSTASRNLVSSYGMSKNWSQLLPAECSA